MNKRQVQWIHAFDRQPHTDKNCWCVPEIKEEQTFIEVWHKIYEQAVQ